MFGMMDSDRDDLLFQPKGKLRCNNHLCLTKWLLSLWLLGFLPIQIWDVKWIEALYSAHIAVLGVHHLQIAIMVRGGGWGWWGSCLEWRERLGTVVTPTQIPGSPTSGHPYQCTQSPNPSTNPKLMTLLTTPFSALHPTFRKIHILDGLFGSVLQTLGFFTILCWFGGILW